MNKIIINTVCRVNIIIIIYIIYMNTTHLIFSTLTAVKHTRVTMFIMLYNIIYHDLEAVYTYIYTYSIKYRAVHLKPRLIRRPFGKNLLGGSRVIKYITGKSEKGGTRYAQNFREPFERACGWSRNILYQNPFGKSFFTRV